MADDLGTQLDLQNQINAAISARAGLLRKQSAFLEGQVLIARELCFAMKCENLEGMEDRLGQIKSSMEQAANEAERLPSTLNESTKAAKGTAGALVKTTVAAGALSGLMNGVKKSFLAVKAAAVGIFDAFKAGFNIVSAGAGLFKKFTSAIIASSTEAAERGLVTARAYEDLRDTFGDLATGVGKEAVDAVGQFDAAAAKAGVNAGQFFGPFAEGQAAKIKAIGAAISNLGDLAVGPLAGQVAGAAFEMTMLTESAGLSAEAMQSLGNRSLNAGQTLKGTMEEAAKSIVTVAKSMGVSTKSLGKNFDSIAKDVVSFGHLSVKEMTTLSAVMTKTGISMASVKKIGSQFDDFEKGAESVAKLTQAFGMQLDSVALLNASDDERLSMMKSSFAATGKSIDQLSRQERAYLANAAGIEDSDLESMFGAQAAGIEETQTAAEKAQDAQVSSAEAMQEMGKSIKKVFAPIEKFLGFFDAWLKGFKKGWSEAGDKGEDGLGAIYTSLRDVMTIGQDLGKWARGFIGEMGGFGAIFDLKGTVNLFKLFSETIKDVFDPNSAGDNAQKFMDALTDMIVNGVEKIGKVFETIGEFLGRPEVQEKIKSGAMRIFESIKGVLTNPVVTKTLIGGGITMLVASMGQILFTTVTGVLPGLLLQGLRYVFGKGIKKGLGKVVSKLFTNLAPKFIGGPYTLVAALIAGFSMAVSGADEKVGAALDEEFGDMSGMTKLAAGFINALTLGLLPEDMLLTVSKFFGNLQKKVLEGLESLGLGKYVDFIKNYTSGLFKVFDSIGDLLKNIFSSGKTKEVSDAGSQFITGLFEMFVAQLKLMPTILFEYVPKALIWVLTESLLLLINYGLPLIINTLVFLGTGLVKAIWNLGAFVVGAFKAALVDPIVNFFSAVKQDGLGPTIMKGMTYAINGIKDKILGTMGYLGKKISDFIGRITFGRVTAPVEEAVPDLSSATEQVAEAADFARTLETAEKALSAEGGALETVTQMAATTAQITEAVGQIDPSAAQAQVANMTNLTADITAAHTALGTGDSGALGVATALVANYNLITDELRKLGEGGVDLDATIDKIERGVTTKRTGIRIDRQQVQLNINLQVNLEAEKLAKALADKTIVDEQFVLSPANPAPGS